MYRKNYENSGSFHEIFDDFHDFWTGIQILNDTKILKYFHLKFSKCKKSSRQQNFATSKLNAK